MKNLPIISSLKIKKLFGKQDLNIDFSNLTVIVGKNGLGKTTLLKIINGLIMGKDQVNYSEICESIELLYSDGHSICYGAINDSFLKSVYKKDVTDVLFENDELFRKIKSVLDQNTAFDEVDKQGMVKAVITAFVQQDNFSNLVYDHFVNHLKKDKDTIFVDKFHRKEIIENVLIRYISTVNISANAGNEMDFGNSVEKNLLDLAIYEELRILLKKKNEKAVKGFKKELNIFLTESGKTAELVKGEWEFKTEAGKSLKLSQLSSGERQLIFILATAANTYGKPTIFLMDEPEVSLHLSWQEKIIDAIMNINPLMQIIAVTHSPGIIMNGHMDAYVEMTDVMKEVESV